MQIESREVANGLLFALRDELDRWLGAVRGGNGTWVPAADMYQEGTELHIEIELPGVEGSDVEILTEGQELTIRALSSDPRAPKEAHLMERRRGTYERTLTLPGSWDATRAKADFQNGVLTLRVPQAVEPERARRITLGGGQPAVQNRSYAAAPAGQPEQKSGPEKLAVNTNQGANGTPKPAEPALAGVAVVGGPIDHK